MSMYKDFRINFFMKNIIALMIVSMYKDFRINFFMKNIIALMMTLVVVGWSIPKPMESITNYNVMMIHGA